MTLSESSSERERPVDPVVSRLYEELRTLAGHVLAGRGEAASVDPTDLVHEGYLKLARLDEFRMLGKSRFLALAASVLRSVLVDLTRRGQARKRGDDWRRTTLSGASEQVADDGRAVDLLDLDEALKRLEVLDPQQHRIVELQFFGGLSGGEIAELLGVTRRAVTKHSTIAKAWLRRELRALGEP